jgi:hypothetical protein
VRVPLTPENPLSPLSSVERSPLLGVVGDALALVALLDDEDGPRPPHVEGLGLGRALHRVHELHLEVVGQGLILPEPVPAPQHVALPLEVRDRGVVLEAGEDLPGLVGKAVALVLGQVDAHRAAVGEVVDRPEDAQDDQGQDQGIGPVLPLTHAEATGGVLPAEDEVHQHQGRGGDQPRAQTSRQGLAGPGPHHRPHRQGEAQRGESVDQSLQNVHGVRPSTAGSRPTGGRGRSRRRSRSGRRSGP